MRNSLEVAAAVPSEVARHKFLRARLLSEIPDLDEETLSDTLEGITDLREVLAEVLRTTLYDEALADALSARISDMRARLERIEARAKRKRQIVLEAMTDASVPKLLAPDFTASLRLGAPVLDVSDEAKIPAAYWRPQPPKLDRQGLIVALKSGTQIDGAVLGPPQPQLSVRVK